MKLASVVWVGVGLTLSACVPKVLKHLHSTARRRLALIQQVTVLLNPRFGLDHTMCAILKTLHRHYRASSCLAVLTDPDSGENFLYHFKGDDYTRVTCAVDAAPEFVQRLKSLPPAEAVFCSARKGRFRAYNTQTQAVSTEGREQCQKLAGVLSAAMLLSAPMFCSEGIMGRAFVLSNRSSSFDESDIELLLQITRQLQPVVDNIRLVDSMAADAAEHERQRIARDLHDSVIQPYIGLQMGLASLRQKLDRQSDVRGDLDHLIEMSTEVTGDLRQMVRSIREGKRIANENHLDRSLVSAVQRFAKRYAQATGIAVEVASIGEIEVCERLTSEMFHMVVEGLSNIRRHTRAQNALVRLQIEQGCLVLEIENEASCKQNPTYGQAASSRAYTRGRKVPVGWSPSATSATQSEVLNAGSASGHMTTTLVSPPSVALPSIAPLFKPRSIEGRAIALCGRAYVQTGSNGQTVVRVEIPL